jgi:RHS repeat-associated protein
VELGNRLTGFEGHFLSYDEDGNLTRRVKPGHDDLTPVWNSLGQMTGAWRYQRGTVSYGYDAFGRRVRRTAPDGTVTRYLYDGDDLLMELDVAGNPIREYTYYPGVDRPHSLRSWPNGGAVYYYATDNPGHVAGVVDGANQVVNKYHYTPWGEPEAVTEGVAQPLRYMAREYDEVTGLYQVRARWYDAQYGRFVSEDPIGLAGGINVYAYADGNPVSNTDPSGLAAIPLAGVTGNGYCLRGKVRGADGRCREAHHPQGEDDEAEIEPGGTAGQGTRTPAQENRCLVARGTAIGFGVAEAVTWIPVVRGAYFGVKGTYLLARAGQQYVVVTAARRAELSMLEASGHAAMRRARANGAVGVAGRFGASYNASDVAEGSGMDLKSSLLDLVVPFRATTRMWHAAEKVCNGQ